MQRCRQIDRLREEYGTGTRPAAPGWSRSSRISSAQAPDELDCIGVRRAAPTSSYTVYLAKQVWGAFDRSPSLQQYLEHSDIDQNIRKVLAALDANLRTHVVDNKESDDIFRVSFVPE